MEYRDINKNKQLTYLVVIFTFILVFEILLRNILGSNGEIINLIKVFLSGVFIIYIIFAKKRIHKTNIIISFIFYLIIILFCIKIIKNGSLGSFVIWIKSNNNINYFFWYIYFFIFSEIFNELDKKIIEKSMIVFNSIIIILSFIFFIKNNYFGMVSYEVMMDYSWVGTGKTRMMGIFANPNHASLYYLLMLFILDYFRLNKKKTIFSISNIGLIICNILTFSRTGLIIMLVYFLIRIKINTSNREKNLISVIIKKYRNSILLIVCIILVSIVVQKFNVYFLNISYLLNNSRFARWNIGLTYMKRYPFLGAPFESDIGGVSERFGEIIFSDNMFIEIGARFGVILFIIFLGYTVYLLIKSIIKKDWLSINKMQAFIIASSFSGTLHFSIPVYLFIFYCFITSEKKKDVGTQEVINVK